MKRGRRIFIWCAIIFFVVFIGPMFIGRIYAVLFSWWRMGITPSFDTIFSSDFLTRLYGLGIWALVVGCLIYAFYSFKDKITKANHNNSSEPKSSKLSVNCPQCGRALKGAKRDMIGDIGVCPKCKAEFTIEQKGENSKEELTG